MIEKLKVGDLVIVAGLRLKNNGTYTNKCKPGRETIFRVGLFDKTLVSLNRTINRKGIK